MWLRLLKGSSTVVVWFFCSALFSILSPFSVSVTESELRFLRNCLPVHPSPNYSTLTLSSHLRQDVGLGEGLVGSFPEMQSDPFNRLA